MWVTWKGEFAHSRNQRGDCWRVSPLRRCLYHITDGHALQKDILSGGWRMQLMTFRGSSQFFWAVAVWQSQNILEIKSVNLWFDVCGTKFKSIDSTDFNAAFTGNREIFRESRVPRDVLRFTASKSSIQFLSWFMLYEEPCCTISPSLYLLTF